MSGRAGVMAGAAAFAVAAAVCFAAVVTLGRVNHPPTPTTPAVSPSVSPSPGNTDVAGAVVNINGLVPDGRLAGTGMVIGADGIVLTNNHVVAGTTGLTGQVAGAGPVYRATVIGVDPTHDVAVIRLEGASGLPTVTLDTSGVLNTGDDVIGMGNALGVNGRPVSAIGVITALNETLTVSGETSDALTTLNGLIQFSAPIQPGDSGGPLLNAAQQVIGMDTAGSAAGSVSAGGGVGDAIPITAALAIAHQILGGVSSPYIQGPHSGVLGVSVIDTSGVDGARVGTVTPDAAAAVAGIAGGDVITAVGAVPVHSVADLGAAVKGRRPGDRITVGWRDPAGASHQAAVVLSPGPPA
jgi:S1-C subfamily serine protease